MAKKSKVRARSAQATNGANGSSVDDMLLAAMERGDGSFETGRYLVTFKEGAGKDAAKALECEGIALGDARDFSRRRSIRGRRRCGQPDATGNRRGDRQQRPVRGEGDQCPGRDRGGQPDRGDRTGIFRVRKQLADYLRGSRAPSR